MGINNTSIWQAGAFNDRRDRLSIISGPSEFRWKRLVTRVACVLADSTRVFVVVPANGRDPKLPSECDIANARLAATVVSRRLRHRLRKRRFHVYLQYARHVRLEVPLDIPSVIEEVTAYLDSVRKAGDEPIWPTPILSYLLSKRLCN